MKFVENLSIKHIIKERVNKKLPLFLMIHGYGSNENDLFAFANDLPKEFFVISIRGFYSIGSNSFSWYNIKVLEENISSDIDQLLISRNKIISFIEEAITYYNLDKKNVWICGFSQGAILSYAIALSKPKYLYRVIALSGFLDEKVSFEEENKDFSSIKLFISHGVYDQIIPISLAKKSLEILKKNNISYSYKEYEEGHELNNENYKDLLKWITDN